MPAFTRMNVAVVTPMPSVSESSATIVSSGVFSNRRSPKRTSCKKDSTARTVHIAVVSSWANVGLPKASRAARRAAAGGMPRSTFSCVSSSMCARISSCKAASS